ncbi:MAG: tripartite tricarboxylate transporter substrate binding protein, partial [Comamonas sp.]|nr:tripartite tricarboxylate transporter substrate binding protein [Candidatus Comamonas equi]
AKINYVAFRGGGEAISAILGGNVTIGGSGLSEFAEYIATGKMKPIGVTSGERLASLDTPTLKEQGIDVEIGNWRGVYGAPGLNTAQRDALVAKLEKATQSAAWQESLKKNDWTPAWLAGDAFASFVDKEFASLQDTMTRAGMV